MKTLKERQADRANRKIENAKLAETVNTGNDRVGNLAATIAAASLEAEALSADDQAELRARLANGGEPTEGYKPAPTFAMAGIGVVNPFVVPTDESLISGGAQAGNGGGEGASVSPGDALSAAAAQAAWGTGTVNDQFGTTTGNTAPIVDETVDADGKALTKAELSAILDEREVTYESDANLATLQGLVKANPAKA